jgi:hypothetical protein
LLTTTETGEESDEEDGKGATGVRRARVEGRGLRDKVVQERKYLINTRNC